MNTEVRDYYGNRIRIECDEQDIQKVIHEKLIAPFAKEFETGWMAKSNAENRIKNYLSYVGSLMIRRPDEYNVVSDRKLRKIKGMEFTTDNIDKPNIKATPAPGKRKCKKSENVKRRDELLARYPSGWEFVRCRVDTDNLFQFDGETYKIADYVSAYRPQLVGDDVYYAMDQVIVATDGHETVFYDMNYELLGTDGVYKV